MISSTLYRKLPIIFIILLYFNTALSSDEPLLAFPRAEGFGAKSAGGRGGRIIIVINLNKNGPGSLQEACSAKGPRIVVFRVSGVIKGDITIEHPNITIAGQTAPGAGITIEGMLRNVWQNVDNRKFEPLHDVTIRFIRCRPPEPRGHNGDCIQLTDIDRIILDHVSVSWGSDENMDLSNTRDLTVQWCTIEESDLRRHKTDKPNLSNPHNFGMIIGYDGRNATIHHNLFAHHSRRPPLCGVEPMDHRNNVIYNVGVGLCWHPPRMNRSRPGSPFRANVIDNYFKAGPSAPKAFAIGKWVAPVIWARYCELYAAGNYFSWIGGVVDPWKFSRRRGVFDRNAPKRAEQPFSAPHVVTQDAMAAYHLVLAQAGCLPRDIVSKRTIMEVRNQAGSWGRQDPEHGLLEGLSANSPPVDSDSDGMPDTWEFAHGLNPKDPYDANEVVEPGKSENNRHAGYTYIEYYINELADFLISTAIANAAN